MWLFEVAAGAALVLSIAAIGISFWESPPQLLRRLELLEVDLQEAIDRMTTWMKKENVRRARDKKDDQESEPGPVSALAPGGDRKAALRARLRAKGNAQ